MEIYTLSHFKEIYEAITWYYYYCQEFNLHYTTLYTKNIFHEPSSYEI